MSALVRAEAEVGASADLVWEYITDWPRQGEWIPLTRVERVDAADGVGGRFRAWTGIGPVGFWDTITITAWEKN
ncbi:MAG TPA: SRPBCC family protein, partial [Nocardioidaceae bacterium]|nr:SRPBCC family protein [Nocardioidaceae bacterium]